jgi:hypothetical protein
MLFLSSVNSFLGISGNSVKKLAIFDHPPKKTPSNFYN